MKRSKVKSVFRAQDADGHAVEVHVWPALTHANFFLVRKLVFALGGGTAALIDALAEVVPDHRCFRRWTCPHGESCHEAA